jgi:8-oxo-dGDP phosphatase
MTDGFARVGEHQVHQGYIWRLVTADFRAPDGSTFSRDIVRSPGAVAVVPVTFDAEGNAVVVLVRQWRAPYEDELWEIPAGMRDVEGESPEATARRELAEEAGYAAGGLVKLHEMYPSPGLTDSVTHIYLATELSEVARDVQGPEEEHMSVVHLPLAEAIEMVVGGDIRDGKTVVGLLLAHRVLSAGDRRV